MNLGLILLIVAVVLVVLLIGVYNRLVALRQNCNQSFADIDVQLRQRHDLIPNLVETVKGYAAHEKGTLDAVIQARNSAVSAQATHDPKAMGQAEGALGAALGRLFALSEAYPDLKANQNFLTLQSQLEGTENRIAVARRDYIEAVRKYNTVLRTIPGRWIAALLYPDAKIKETFSVEPNVEQAPKVNFTGTNS